MSLTLIDICERLKQMDEVELLEILKVTSEQLVDRCQDLVEDNFDSLQELLNWEDSDE